MSLELKKLHLQGLPVELQNKMSSFFMVQEEDVQNGQTKAFRQPRRILSNQEILEELAKQKVIQQNLMEVSKNSRIEGSYIAPQNVSKVPSKNHGPRRGFGSSANRFPENKLDIDVPVAYYTPTNKSIQNFNKKGFGNGFVSKSVRFSLGLYQNLGPGPGSYFDMEETETTKTINIGLDSPNSYLHPRIKKRPIVRPLHKKDNFPGPGEYDPKQALISKSSPNYHSVFHSSSTRNILPRTIDNEELNLTPEQYQVARSLEHKKPQQKKQESYFFANPVIVNKPNPFYEPLINQVVHQTNADITKLYSEVKLQSQKQDQLYIDVSPHAIKKPILIRDKSFERPKESPKDQIFGSHMKIPRIHS